MMVGLAARPIRTRRARFRNRFPPSTLATKKVPL